MKRRDTLKLKPLHSRRRTDSRQKNGSTRCQSGHGEPPGGFFIRGVWAIPFMLIAACAEGPGEDQAERLEALCWSTDTLNVAIAQSRLITRPLDTRTGSYSFTPSHDNNMVDIPLDYRRLHPTALRQCQRRRDVPLRLKSLNVHLAQGALGPGSPQYDGISLLSTNDSPVPFDRLQGKTLSQKHLWSLKEKRLIKSSSQKTYRYLFASNSGESLNINCSKRFGEPDDPQTWTRCSAQIEIKEGHRYWITFNSSRTSSKNWPKIVGNGVEFLASMDLQN